MIFCVEDDQSSRALMCYTLNASGFNAEGFENAETLRAGLRQVTPELIILDIMLPDEDGIAILQRLRARPETAEIPIIMATAKGTEYDKVLGLDLGADDYLVKPFGMMEMVSRVRALLRRSGQPKRAEVLSIGGITMDTGAHTVRVDGRTIELTLKEYELLHLLMSNPGRLFSRDMLLSRLWEGYFGETRTVDVHIGTLRMKLGDEAARIKTVRGLGYRMEQTP